MIYLLIGGAQSVGKSDAIIRTTQNLLNNGFSVVAGVYPPTSGKDILIVVEGLDKTKNKIRILINSATDTVDTIWGLKIFHDNNLPIDFIISSVRDNGSYPRTEFFTIMNIQPTVDTVIEIPLAKITRRNVFNTALSWYQNTIDKLIQHTLSNSPFNIF